MSEADYFEFIGRCFCYISAGVGLVGLAVFALWLADKALTYVLVSFGAYAVLYQAAARIIREQENGERKEHS